VRVVTPKGDESFEVVDIRYSAIKATTLQTAS
jgi:hypothetical protein